MDYRGSDRFRRCLDSVRTSEHLFSRVIISITAAPDSEDVRIAHEYMAAKAASGNQSKAEIICTKVEMPTMAHQAFWVDYLERTGVQGSDWIYWLAYDDQIRQRGIESLISQHGGWPLRDDTAYFGPWGLRHEKADELFSGPWDSPIESWSTFSLAGPTRLTVIEWVTQQLKQPTYMQMSGSICTFESYLQLRHGRPRKNGPMRIEMAVATATCNLFVEELSEPVSIVYGRPDSDRASYGSAARKEDVHLLAWLARYAIANPSSIPSLARGAMGVTGAYLKALMGLSDRVEEEWIVRESVLP
jgi:hypothetical protein